MQRSNPARTTPQTLPHPAARTINDNLGRIPPSKPLQTPQQVKVVDSTELRLTHAKLSSMLRSVASDDESISERLNLAENYQLAASETSGTRSSDSDNVRTPDRRSVVVQAELHELYRGRRNRLRALASAGFPNNCWVSHEGALLYLKATDHKTLTEYALYYVPQHGRRYLIPNEEPQITRKRIKYASTLRSSGNRGWLILAAIFITILLAELSALAGMGATPILLLLSGAILVFALAFNMPDGTHYLFRYFTGRRARDPFDAVPPRAPRHSTRSTPTVVNGTNSQTPDESPAGNQTDKEPLPEQFHTAKTTRQDRNRKKPASHYTQPELTFSETMDSPGTDGSPDV